MSYDFLHTTRKYKCKNWWSKGEQILSSLDLSEYYYAGNIKNTQKLEFLQNIAIFKW